MFVDFFSKEAFRSEIGSAWTEELDDALAEGCDGVLLVKYADVTRRRVLVPYGAIWRFQTLVEAYREYGAQIIAHLRVKRGPVVPSGVAILANMAEFQSACACIHVLRSLDEILSVGQPEGAALLAKRTNDADQMIVVYGSRYMAREYRAIVDAWPPLGSERPLSSDNMVTVAHVKFACPQPTDEELREHFGLITTSSVIEVERLIVNTLGCSKCGAARGTPCVSRKSGKPVPIHNCRAELGRTQHNQRAWRPQYLAWQERLIAYNDARDKRDGRV